MLTSAIYLALVYVLFWIAFRVGGLFAVYTVGTAAIGFLIYSIIDVLVGCSAEPEFVPPECDDETRCGLGQMVFACDSAGGALAYGFAYIFGPMTVVLVFAMVGRFSKMAVIEKAGT